MHKRGPGRPKLPASERRSIAINVRLTPPEHEIASALAVERGAEIPDILREPIQRLAQEREQK